MKPPEIRSRAGLGLCCDRSGWAARHGGSVIRTYLNYPNSKVRIHADPTCGHIQQAGKSGQRLVVINLGNLSTELTRFSQQQHAFGSTAAENDMWLEIDLGDDELERAVVSFIRRVLATRYQPFAAAGLENHC